MARRLFNGRAFSENGWPYVDEGSCTWVRIPGAEHVSLQIQNGPPLAILRAFAADFHANVEPLRDHDSACWTPGNSVATSNHPGGTSMDLNWNGADGKTFRYGISEAQAYPGDKARRLRELLDFYEGFVFCGGFWSIRDWMHFQVGANTYDQRADRPQQRTLDFIARKIRADGFSTFGRGNAARPGDPALILSRATGLDLNRAQEILPTMQQGLREADCTTPLRIAMFIAQTGHESAGFNATEEYQNGPMDQERWIYKGRTWIQITWRSHYAEFGQWCFRRGLVADPDVFVDNPRSLADLRWAGLGAAWYWVETRREARAYPTLNEASDAGDLVTATQIVNGGTNGIDDRRERYNRALAVGDALTQILNGDDFLPALNDAEQRELLDLLRWIAAPGTGELRKRFPSRSMYATGPEGDTFVGRVLGDHAFGWDDRVEPCALRGETWAIDLVVQAAAGALWGVRQTGDGRPDSFLMNHAQSVLAQIETQNPQFLQNYLAQKGSA